MPRDTIGPSLPPLPERLDMKAVKRLCMAVLNQTLKDAALKIRVYEGQASKWRDDALWFAKSDLCVTICELYDIDYKSFLSKVESNYRKGVESGKILEVHSGQDGEGVSAETASGGVCGADCGMLEDSEESVEVCEQPDRGDSGCESHD